MNVLAIINTYNFRGISAQLHNVLKGWLEQELNDYYVDVVISDNGSTDRFLDEIRQFCKDNNKDNLKFHAFAVIHKHPVYPTFNAAIKFKNSSKHYDYYIYNSEDCVMSKSDDLVNILKEFDNPRAAMVFPIADFDNTNFYFHFDGYLDTPGQKIPIGESLNMHFAVFSRYYMEKYDFKFVDVLTAFADESLLTFFCAAIDRDWLACRRVVVNHQKVVSKMKGYSGYHTYANFKSFDQLFKPGYDVGLGFECCQGWFPFNPDCYDNDGRCKKPQALYDYIKENLFLSKELVDYDELVDSAIKG